MTNVDRTPKPCLHKRADHQHGHRLAYILDRCRCLPCCAANSAYESRRTRLRAYGRGTPNGWVDAAPVRAHVEQLQAAGMGWKRIGCAAGVPNGTMTRLIFGKKEDGRYHPPSTRINPDAARLILAVPMPTVDQLGGAAVIDGTGTRRRLQALVAAGWTQTHLAGQLGMSVGNFNSLILGHRRKDGAGRVLASTYRAVTALYDELWNQPAPAGAGRGRALAAAERHDWTPPLAWDDDEIDNPDARPRGTTRRDQIMDEVAIQRAMHGDPVHLRADERAEATRRMTAAGYPASEIAARLHIAARSVQRIRSSAGAA